MPFSRPILLGSVFALAACTASAPDRYQNKTTDIPEPAQSDRLWPGDELAISVLSAPELSRQVTLLPDGKIEFPPLGRIDAAGQMVESLHHVLEAGLATELIDPSVEVVKVGAGPYRVFVGGAVDRPGAVELPGHVGPLEAIIMAGDFRSDARQADVMLIRKTSTGALDTVVYDLSNGIADEAFASWGPLQPFDVIYVAPGQITGSDGNIGSRLNGILPI
ncbi:MAG: polysaccharide biosynthesis/export family protein, partial [Pseudomonadota bacterium]